MTLPDIPFVQRIVEATQNLIDGYGYWGIFGLNTLEQFIFPLPSDPFMSAAVVGGLDPHRLIWFIFVATLLGAIIGYALGRYLGHPAARWLFGETRLEKAEKFVKKWGIFGVILTGLTPIPFKIATWSAGIFEMKFWKFLVGVVIGRMPRYILVVYGTRFFAQKITLEGNWGAMILGAVQGATEFLPVSSSGHLVVVEKIMRIPLAPEHVDMFNVFLHGGSLIAILLYFWKDWWEVLKDIWQMLKDRKIHPNSLAFTLAAATVPVLLGGFFFHELLSNSLSSLVSVGIAFICIGVIFFYSSWKGRGNTIEHIYLKKAVMIGLSQVIGLIPGISRSGITIAAGTILGIKREVVARFSFMLGGIAILAANVFTLLQIYFGDKTAALPDLSFVVIGFLSSFVVSLGAIFLFLKYLKKHSLRWFGTYLVILGIVVLSVFNVIF